jgi:hypothetical protein
METLQIDEHELLEKYAIHREVKYENLHGVNIPILFQELNKNETHNCPFCNKVHYHSCGEGHRTAHCADTSFPPYNNSNSRWLVSDGVLLSQKNGYIIRNP